MNLSGHDSPALDAALLQPTTCLDSDSHCSSGVFEPSRPRATRTRRLTSAFDCGVGVRVRVRVRVALGARAPARAHDSSHDGSHALGPGCATDSAKRCVGESAPLWTRASLPPLAARALRLSPLRASSSPPASAPAPIGRRRRRCRARARVCSCSCAAACSERTGSGRRGAAC